MSAAWSVELSPRAAKTLRKLDPATAKRVIKTLNEISTLNNPRSRGKALTGVLSGLWRYRAGDYRIICDINNNTLIIFAIEIGHRSHIYN